MKENSRNMTEYVCRKSEGGGRNFSKSQSLYRGGEPEASGKIKKCVENMKKYADTIPGMAPST